MHNVAMKYQVFMQKHILENVFCVHISVNSPKKAQKRKSPIMSQRKYNIYELRIKIPVKINDKSVVCLLVFHDESLLTKKASKFYRALINKDTSCSDLALINM